MNQFLFIISFVLIGHVCAQEPEGYSWKTDGLKGKVKTVRQVETASDTAEDNGDIVIVSLYGLDGRLQERDDEQIGYYLEKSKYLYGENGLIKEVVMTAEESYTRFLYSYNSFNLLLSIKEMETEVEDDYLVRSVDYEYAPQAMVESTSDADGKILSINESYLDGRMNDTLIIRRGANGTALEKEVRRFDNKNRRIFSKAVKDGIVTWRTNISYPNDTTVVTETTDQVGTSSDYTKKVYYSNGDLAQMKVDGMFNSHADYNYSYVYDDKGNWIKRIGYKDGQLVFVYKREIEYYE